jgi:hypothetical protein
MRAFARGFILREPTGARYDGLTKLSLRDKGTTWTFTFNAVANLSAADDPEMTLSIGSGTMSLSITRHWLPKPYGWFLRHD